MAALLEKSTHSIANGLLALLNVVLSEGIEIPKMYHPIIQKMVADFLKRTSEDDLRKIIVQLRDEIIPAVLGEPSPNNDSK